MFSFMLFLTGAMSRRARPIFTSKRWKSNWRTSARQDGDALRALLRDGQRPELGTHGARLHDARSRRRRARRDAVTAIRSSFLRGIADEFIQPIVLEKPNRSAGRHRQKRRYGHFFQSSRRPHAPARQIARGFRKRANFSRSASRKFDTVCLTEYDRSFDLPVAFSPGKRRIECSGASFRRKRHFKLPRDRNGKIRAHDIFF